jgi:hypothetical protein
LRLGRLLPEHFLREGIQTTASYRAASGGLPALRERLAAVFAAFPTEERPNEAQTEQDLIFPVLDALGWD